MEENKEEELKENLNIENQENTPIPNTNVSPEGEKSVTINEQVNEVPSEVPSEVVNEAPNVVPSEVVSEVPNEALNEVANEVTNEVVNEVPPVVEQSNTSVENTNPTETGTTQEANKGIETVNNVTEDGNKPKKKNKPILIIVVLLIIILAIIAVCLFLLGGNKNKNDKKEETTTTENKEKASPFRLKSNDLEDFDLEFLRLENANGNIIYSPLSIKYALAMLNEGTDGESHKQIENLIGDYKGKKYTNSQNLSIANAFFIKDSYKSQIKEAFVETLKNKYDAEIIPDPFESPYAVNSWVKSKTLNLIDEIMKEMDPDTLFFIVNALGIDMEWKNNFILIGNGYVDGVLYDSMDFYWSLRGNGSPTVVGDKFDGMTEKVAVMDVGASFNNYDILKDKGEENYKNSVKAWYKKCFDEVTHESYTDEKLNEYTESKVKSITSNYGREEASTDFMIYVDDDVKVFAKDLQEYDGVTLQYVGVMPIKNDLNTFVKELNAKKLKEYISNLKELKKENFEDGYITRITGYIPKFKYEYELNLQKDLEELGVKDIFDKSKADLSKIASDNLFINEALHKANIEFTQYGIKAAAVTAVGGKGNTTSGCNYIEKDYKLKDINITFDKPYLYVIRDKDSGEVWFTGEVYEPQLWSTDPDFSYYGN